MGQATITKKKRVNLTKPEQVVLYTDVFTFSLVSSIQKKAQVKSKSGFQKLRVQKLTWYKSSHTTKSTD